MSIYHLSPSAQADLDGIWDYTSANLGETQADEYTYTIRDRLAALASNRMPARSAADIRSGYLKSAVGSHMIYFRSLESGAINVIRILHQSMDATGRLGG